MKTKGKQVIAFFCSIFFIFAAGVFAQSNKLSGAVEGGLGFRSLSGNELVDNNTKSDLGYIFGVSGQYSFSENYSLKAGLYFQKKGAKANTNNTDSLGNPTGTSDIKINFNYLTIPVLFKSTFGSGLKFFVNAGPYLGILLSAKDEIPAIGNQPANTIDTKDITESIDFGLTGGIGIIIPAGKKLGISIEIRDDLGLVNISKAPVYNGGTLKNNTLNFIAGIVF